MRAREKGRTQQQQQQQKKKDNNARNESPFTSAIYKAFI